jgi:DNA-binding NtrC family response regulator
MIKTDGDVMWADVLVRSLRQRISMVHAVLYILRDDWLDELGNLYEEIVEATVSKFETQVPIVCVLPRGADVHSLKYTPPGVATVKWSSAAIIRAVRKHALPVLASEMRMTRSQSVERARIRSCIKANAGAVGRTAAALHMSRKTLKQKMLSYIIR